MKIQKISGISLVEVLVAIGLTSILSVFLMTVFENSRKESALLDQKLALTSLKRDLISYGSAQDICKKSFSETTSSFPTANIPNEVELSRLYASATSTLKLAEKDKPITPNYTNFKVASIKLKQLQPIGTNIFSGKLIIETVGSKVPFQPIELRVVVKSTTVGVNTQFEGCVSSEATLALANVSCASGKVLNGFDAAGEPICISGLAGVSCPSGYYLQGFNGSGGPDCKILPASAAPPPAPLPPAPPPSFGWVYNSSYGGTTEPVQTPGVCNASNLGQSIISGKIDSYVCGAPGGCCLACGNWYCVNQGETILGCTTSARCGYL